MGKLALILVLAASAAGLHHASSAAGGLRGSADQSAEQQRLVQARVAAQTGWARTKQALSRSFAGTTVTGTNDGTPYVTTAVVTGDNALVTSVGRAPRSGGTGETTYTIVYSLLNNVTRLTPRPRFLDYAIAAGGNVSFSGTADVVRLGVTDRSRDTTTLTVHANGTLSAGGGSVIRGFGTYTAGVTAGTSDSFRPAYNPRSQAVVRRTGALDIPLVNPDALVAEDGVDYPYPLGTSLSNVVLPGGTRLAPAIYRFRGDVALSNVTVTGYAVFVADGNVTVSGTVQGQPLGYTGPQESALAIYTPATVRMGGHATLYAQIVASSGVSYEGGVRLFGSAVVGGNYTQSGTSAVHYRPASPALSQGFTGRPGPGATLLAVREQ